MKKNIIFHRLLALLILGLLMLVSIEQGLASGILLSGAKQDPYPGYTPPPTYDPYPGITPFPTYDPYPGVTPTPGTTALTPTTSFSQVPPRTPTQGTVVPHQLTTTVEFVPLPTFDLLFPSMLSQGTPTPEAASVAVVASFENETEGIISSPVVGFLGVLIIVIWGLLGLFLVIFLKRVGY
ncbi:MAG: hypothetical protein EHM41_20935 [Chloroflexi bacterium]|nr:MAG: hypothetical protein EHM41_20935 [Chloroflexota bacterium]